MADRTSRHASCKALGGMLVELCPYDPAWPATYASLRTEIEAALGDRVVRLEHVGSTAVAGLSAKPTIDLVLEVTDSRDEAAYVPLLDSYELLIREPAWHEHRLLHRAEPAVNLHVFSGGCPETAEMVRFRDALRGSAALRGRYESGKRELAMREWGTVQDYADAKSAVVAEILALAR